MPIRFLIVLALFSSSCLLSFAGEQDKIEGGIEGEASDHPSGIALPHRMDPLVLSLEDCVRIALKKNLNILDKFYGFSIAGFGIEDQEFDFQFQLRTDFALNFEQALEDEVTAEDISRSTVALNKLFHFSTRAELSANNYFYRNPEDYYASNIKIKITQPLLRGFGEFYATAELAAAKSARDASRRELGLTEQDTIYDVAAAYYDIIRQKAIIEATGQSLLRLNNLLKQARGRQKAGLVSRMDILRYEVRVSQADYDLLESRERLQTLKDQLILVLGLDPGRGVEVLEREFKMNPAPIRLEDEIMIAVANRLDLLDEAEKIVDRERDMKVALDNLSPQFDVFASFRYQGENDNFEDSWQLDTPVWTVGVQMDPLTTRNRAPYKESVYALEQQKNLYLKKKREVITEVRRSVRTIERLEEQIDVKSQEKEQAEREFDLARLRYNKGLATSLEVVDAESSLLNSTNELIEAQTSYSLQEINLKKLTGLLRSGKDIM